MRKNTIETRMKIVGKMRRNRTRMYVPSPPGDFAERAAGAPTGSVAALGASTMAVMMVLCRNLQVSEKSGGSSA
jgi:hypothetical protein